MVCQDDNVGLLNERKNRFSKCFAAGCLIASDRNVAKKHFHFWQYTLRDWLACDCERSRVRWMAVNNALDIRSRLVYLQVQQGLARSLLDARRLLARHVHSANIFGLQKTFAMHGWGTQDFVFTDPNGDVAIVGCRKAFVVKPPAHFADVLLDLVSIHGSPFSGFGKFVNCLMVYWSRLNVKFVDDSGVVGIDRLLARSKRLGCFSPIAYCDDRSLRCTQVVPNDDEIWIRCFSSKQRLAIRLRCFERCSKEARMSAAKRDRSVDLIELHLRNPFRSRSVLKVLEKATCTIASRWNVPSLCRQY